MYVQANRGMGDVMLNCPGDPGCPGYVAPGSAEYQTSLMQEILANQQAGGGPVIQTAPAPTSTGTLTAWLNANSTTVAIGAAAFVGLLFFMRAGR